MLISKVVIYDTCNESFQKTDMYVGDEKMSYITTIIVLVALMLLTVILVGYTGGNERFNKEIASVLLFALAFTGISFFAGVTVLLLGGVGLIIGILYLIYRKFDEYVEYIKTSEEENKK